jgi:succinate-acetate transporter protein
MPPDGSPTSEEMAITRITLRPIATPLPVGFLGLLVATAAFACLQLGWLPPEQGRQVALAALLLTVPLQLLAAVYGFLARDPVAGTGMAVLAGTWAVVGWVTLTSPEGSTSAGLGVVLLLSAACLLVPASAATSKLVPAGVIALSAVRFAVTGIAELTGSPAWLAAAGVVGLALAVLAFYAALALELEDVQHRTVLPLLRQGPGGEAIRGTVAQQVEQVQHEAGVRNQL